MALKGSVNQRDRKKHAPKRQCVGFQTADPGSPEAGGVGGGERGQKTRAHTDLMKTGKTLRRLYPSRFEQLATTRFPACYKTTSKGTQRLYSWPPECAAIPGNTAPRETVHHWASTLGSYIEERCIQGLPTCTDDTGSTCGWANASKGRLQYTVTGEPENTQAQHGTHLSQLCPQRCCTSAPPLDSLSGCPSSSLDQHSCCLWWQSTFYCLGSIHRWRILPDPSLLTRQFRQAEEQKHRPNISHNLSSTWLLQKTKSNVPFYLLKRSLCTVHRIGMFKTVDY